MIYSRTWVRNTVYALAIVPTIWVYAEFILAIKLLQTYQEAKSEGKWYEKPLKAVIIPAAIRFIRLDILFDIVIGSLLFRQWPEWGRRDKTFTARLKMYKKDYENMLEDPRAFDKDVVARYKLAVKFGELLNKVDPGHF